MTLDPSQLAHIHAQCFTNSRTWSKDEFRDLLSLPNTILAAEHAGFALARIAADQAELLSIATIPDMRRSGVAQRLLGKLETQVQAGGAMCVFLEVAQDNTAAKALYHSMGYQETGRRTGYYQRTDGAQVDALILSKIL